MADTCGSLTQSVKDLYSKMKSWFHKGAKDISHLGDKISEWAKEYVHAIDVDDLLKTDPDMLVKVAAAWKKFDANQLTQLKAASKEQWDKMVATIPPEHLAAMSATLQKSLNITKRIAGRVNGITLEQVAKWGDETWDSVPIDNMVFLSWGVLQQVPLKELGKWTQEQWVKIPIDKLVRFTGKQIQKIDAKSVAALSDKYWDLVPVYQISHFGVELIQSAGLLEKLNATQVAAFTTEQWMAVPVESVLKFTIKKTQAIDYVALGHWSKKVWDKVPIDKITEFVDRQIEAIPPDVVGNWTQKMWLKFPTEKAIMFTGTQLITGANALKDMTEEQLSKYDWSQITEDQLAKLPPKLQQKIKNLRKFLTNFNTTEYKQRVYRAADAKVATTEKLKELQLANDNPKATPAQKKVTQAAYDQAVTKEKSLTTEVQTETVQMYVIPPKVGSPGARAAASSVTMLLAALWMQG